MALPDVGLVLVVDNEFEEFHKRSLGADVDGRIGEYIFAAIGDASEAARGGRA